MDDPAFLELNALRLWDFRFDFSPKGDVRPFDSVTILGSTDFSYYHNAEVLFFNVRYICCPTFFSEALFGIASQSAHERLRTIAMLDQETRLYCITAEADSRDATDHFIAASDVRVTIDKFDYKDIPTTK